MISDVDLVMTQLRLRDERIAELEAALRKIAETDDDGSYMGERHAKCCEIARAVLSKP